MNFTLSEQQAALQQSVRKFAQQELPAIAKHIEESDEPPGLEQALDQLDGAARAGHKARNPI